MTAPSVHPLSVNPLLSFHFLEASGNWHRNRIRQVVIVGLHRNDLRRSLRPLLTLWNVRYSEDDAALNRIDFHHTNAELHPLPHDVGGRIHRLAKVQLAHRNEALDVVADV